MLDRGLESGKAKEIEDLAVAAERVAVAAAAADRHGLVLTARCESHLRGRDDIEDTIRRLMAFREAGAHVVYAPGLMDLSAIVESSRSPARPSTSVGSRRSICCPTCRRWRSAVLGRGLAGPDRIRGVVAAAAHLQGAGILNPDAPYLSAEAAKRAFVAAED